MRLIFVCIIMVFNAVPVWAQPSEGVFADYAALRAALDGPMKRREVDTVLVAFGGADEYTSEQLRSLRDQVAGIYPNDFEHVAEVRRVSHENGWRQELLAYWTGTSYIYAYVLIHDRGSDVVAVHFQFNSDFAELNTNF